jgi:hypothetical protein
VFGCFRHLVLIPIRITSAMDVQALPALSHGHALLALETFLRAKKSTMSWHTIVNNTTSTRPKVNGGNLFKSLTALEQTRQTRDGEHTCTISMPCSFDTGDSEGFTVERTGNSQREAIEAACLRVFAILCLKDRRRVIFRSSHWKCSLEELLEGISRIVDNEQVADSLTTASQSFYPATCQPPASNSPRYLPANVTPGWRPGYMPAASTLVGTCPGDVVEF